MYRDRHKSQSRCNLILSMMCGLSLFGCLIFMFADTISEWYMQSQVATSKSARHYALFLGIVGFLLMQCGLIIAGDSITEILVNTNPDENQLDLWVFRWKGIGRISGFLLASLDIFETYTLSLYYTVGDNLTFSYCFWILLQTLLLGVLLPIMNSYDNTFRYSETGFDLPSLVLLWQSPVTVKCMLLSHFFSYGSYLLISIYATSWMTLSLFSGSPQGAKFVVHRRDFDLGISWGACDMLILSTVSLLFSILYSYNFKCERQFWCFSNFLAGIGLSFACFFDKDSFTFGFLPLCSLIFTTTLLAPQRLSVEYDKKFTKVCTAQELPHRANECKGPSEMFHIPPYCIPQWEKLMVWAEEGSKFMALCIIPMIYAVFPDFDDSRWAMKISSLWGLIGGFFCVFI